MKTFVRSIAFFVCLSFALLAHQPVRAKESSGTTAPTQKSEESVYILPEYKVSARRILPEPESWRYAINDKFEILSNASDSTTQKICSQFGEYLNVLGSISPGMKIRTTSPMKLIICGQMGSFSKITGTLNAPVVTGHTGDQIAFIINLAGDFIIPFNSASSDADDPWAFVENRVYKNYLDLRLTQFKPRLPPWLEHATRIMYVDMKFNGKTVTFAEIRNGKWANFSPNTNTLVNGSRVLPLTDEEDDATLEAFGGEGDSDDALGEMMGRDPSSNSGESYNDAVSASGGVSPGTYSSIPRKIRIIPMSHFFAYIPGQGGLSDAGSFDISDWSRQSVLFMHYWLYRRTSTPKNKAGFAKFVERATRGSIDEAFFKECFGVSYKNMEWDLSNYREFTDYNYQEFKFTGDTRPPPVVLKEATPAQIGRMKGEAMVNCGKPDEGYNELLAPYLRKAGDTDLHAALGLFEYARRNTTKTRALLEIAVKDRTTRADAYRALSTLRLADINAANSNNAPLTPEQLDQVIAPLLAARAIPPDNVETYIQLTDALRKAAQPPTKEQAIAVLQGVNQYPTNPRLTALAASVLLRTEYTDQARNLVERALKQPGQSQATLAWLKQASDDLAHRPPAKPTDTPTGSETAPH